MVFKKKGTDEEFQFKASEEPKKEESKTEEKPEDKHEEKELTFEDVLVNHEKRIAHLESVLLQLRNSI